MNHRAPTIMDERGAVQAAMNRLLTGTAQASNGRLTISALAMESDLSRQALYERHPELLAEFRILTLQAPPADAASQALQEQLARAHRRNTELQNEVTTLTAKLRALTSILVELSVEAETTTNVTRIQTRKPRR